MTLRSTIRQITAVALVPIMKITGFRFSKHYRWEIDRFHSLVYRWIDTVGANHMAGI